MLVHLKKSIQALQIYSQRWWYTPLMGGLVFISLFIPVFPSDPLVIKTFLLKPKRWWLSALFFTLCSVLAATLLAYLVSLYGEVLIAKITGPEFFADPRWLNAKQSISEYGATGLFFFALSPIPPQPAVFAAGLAGMPLLKVFSVYFIGRIGKYSLYGLIFLVAPDRFKQGREFFRSRQQSKADHPNQS